MTTPALLSAHTILRGLYGSLACDMIGMGDSEKLPESGPGRYTNAEHCEYMVGLWDRLQRGDEVVFVVAPSGRNSPAWPRLDAGL